MVLYGVTALWEAPVIVVRYVTALVVATVALKATGHAGASASTWAKLALAPTVWSLASLASAAPGGWLWRTRMGGRLPSTRETQAREDAMRRLRAAGADRWAEPKKWFVVDVAEPHAEVRGDTLMLTRGALESRYLPALLAHELGHLRGMDARLMAAVEHLEVVGHRRVGSATRSTRGAQEAVSAPGTPGGAAVRTREAGLLWSLARGIARVWLELLRGGWGVATMAPAWGELWREAEYGADEYAASLGEGETLAQFLELHALSQERPVRWAWLKGQPSPPVALRVERLRAAASPDGDAGEHGDDREGVNAGT